MDGYSAVIKPLSTDNGVFRGVRCNDRPEDVSRISYPPPACVKENGRANRVGQSMFYASFSAGAVFYEMRVRPGDNIVLSYWKFIAPIWVQNLGYHEDTLRRLGVKDMSLRQSMIQKISDESRLNAQRRRRLALVFTQKADFNSEKFKYKLSIAITEFLLAGSVPPVPQSGLFDDIQMAGVIYPSMQTKGMDDNIVLRPAFVDNCLSIEETYYYQVESVDHASLACTLLPLAKWKGFQEGKIQWEDVTHVPADERRCRVTYEDGHWVIWEGDKRIF